MNTTDSGKQTDRLPQELSAKTKILTSESTGHIIQTESEVQTVRKETSKFKEEISNVMANDIKLV